MLTEEKMEEFEKDVQDGKEMDAKKYLEDVETNYRNNLKSCLLTTLSKDVLDDEGKKIRNITIEELTDEELEKRLKFHVIKFEDVKKLAEQIDKLTNEYSNLYNLRSIYVSLSVIFFRPVLPLVFVCPLFLVVPMSAHYDFTFANLVPFRI